MKNEPTEIYVHKSKKCDELSFFIDQFPADGKKNLVAAPVTFVEIDPFATDGPPTFSLSEKEAQHLIDQLWACGLCPDENYKKGVSEEDLADLIKRCTNDPECITAFKEYKRAVIEFSEMGEQLFAKKIYNIESEGKV